MTVLEHERKKNRRPKKEAESVQPQAPDFSLENKAASGIIENTDIDTLRGIVSDINFAKEIKVDLNNYAANSAKLAEEDIKKGVNPLYAHKEKRINYVFPKKNSSYLKFYESYCSQKTVSPLNENQTVFTPQTLKESDFSVIKTAAEERIKELEKQEKISGRYMEYLGKDEKGNPVTRPWATLGPENPDNMWEGTGIHETNPTTESQEAASAQPAEPAISAEPAKLSDEEDYKILLDLFEAIKASATKAPTPTLPTEPAAEPSFTSVREPEPSQFPASTPSDAAPAVETPPGGRERGYYDRIHDSIGGISASEAARMTAVEKSAAAKTPKPAASAPAPTTEAKTDEPAPRLSPTETVYFRGNFDTTNELLKYYSGESARLVSRPEDLLVFAQFVKLPQGAKLKDLNYEWLDNKTFVLTGTVKDVNFSVRIKADESTGKTKIEDTSVKGTDWISRRLEGTVKGGLGKIDQSLLKNVSENMPGWIAQGIKIENREFLIDLARK